MAIRLTYTDSKGKVWLFTEMETIHLDNAIKKMERNSSDDIEGIRAMKQELAKRDRIDPDDLPKFKPKN